MTLIFRIIFQTFFIGVRELILETYCLQESLLHFLAVLRAFARKIRSNRKLFCVGDLLNCLSACFLAFLACLFTSLYDGLWIRGFAEVLGIDFSAFSMMVSENTSIGFSAKSSVSEVIFSRQSD